jgi:NAD(P)-dependent dehydrogenase (short-subunit alcohol dehydrogenase family)
MKPISCVITGANSGIGKQAAIQLARLGARVTLACRNEARGATALESVRAASGSDAVDLMQVDMSLRGSIREFARRFLERHDTLDVLIHNAAFFDIGQRERAVTEEGIETTWATNHIGPVLLTDLLLPALRNSDSGRVLISSSKGLVLFPRLRVDLADPEFETREFSVHKAYYQSKLAQVAYMLDLATRLEGTAITVHGIRVTNVKLDVSRYPRVSRFMLMLYAIKSRFSIGPDEMARTHTWLATSTTAAETTGMYWDAPDRPVTPSRGARDPTHRREIMELTARYVGGKRS